MKKFIEYLIIFGLGAYIIRLFVSDDINKYVNDRYVFFTVLAGVFVVIFVVLMLIKSVVKNRKMNLKLERDTVLTLASIVLMVLFISIELYIFALASFLYLIWINRTKKINLNSVVLIGIIMIGLLVPAKTLSSSLAENRVDTANGYVTDLSKATKPVAFDTSNYDLETWVNTISLRPNASEFEGKKVKDVEGFIFFSDDLDEDMFLVSKFVLRCCAVDAIPVGILVENAGWKEQFSEDDWVSVSGVIQVKEIDGEEKIVVTDSEIIPIEEPDNPYISQ